MMDGSIIHATAPADLSDGIYFGLSDDAYHALPRLSASGIKNLLVSPMDFWARSWLNPNPSDDELEPEWATKGRAYHARICEGREAFYARYVKGCEPSDYPGCLETNDDLKAECKAMELKVSGNKDELIERLLAAGCRKPIWQVVAEEFRQEHAGKTPIPAEWIFDIELAAACVEKPTTLSKAFKGGFAEVAVLWHAEVERNDGSVELFKVPMKAKFDYLKPGAIVDLKTMANKMMKPLDRAVYYDIAANRYHIQVATYFGACEAAKALIASGKVEVLSGATPSKAWLEAVAKTDKKFLMVHIQKGVAPVAVGNVFSPSMGLVSVGAAQVREAQQAFHDHMEHFGPLPWIVDRPLQELSDTDIPAFATE